MSVLQRGGWESLAITLPTVLQGFKGNFLKIHCNKSDPTLLDGFPLYWTKKPRVQWAKCLEDMPQQDREVCLFFSSLKVVFDTATLKSKKFSPVGHKAYIGIFTSFTLAGVGLYICLLSFPCFLMQTTCWVCLTRRTWRPWPKI